MGKIKDVLERIAGSFQPAYNRINDWDAPWLRDICRQVWSILDDRVKSALYDLAVRLYDKYGEAAAKKIMEKLIADISKAIAK